MTQQHDISVLPTHHSGFGFGLNPQQQQAVDCLIGPVLVLAGAGTGKTKVLTTRIANIIAQKLARPWEILSVTFTNKAAREMNERIAELIGNDVGLSWSGTFHSVAAKILRRHAELVGLQSNFTILNDDDQERLLKQLLEADGVDIKKTPPKILLSIIDGWKNKALFPKDIRPQDIPDIYHGKSGDYYKQYQERLLTLNAVDFNDLLLFNIKIFKENHDVLSDYHHRFRFICVDEYQDTNIAQYLWLRLLSQAHKNICCVGDDDQSIYAWRGAEVGNILKFEKDFADAVIIRLEQNYRSTPTILSAASGLITYNKGRLGKTLFSHLPDNDKINVSCHWDGEQEALFLIDIVEELQRFRGIALRSMAILVRTSAQMRVFEERMISCAVPYRVVGGLKFYERQEIRDAMSYLRLVAQPHDDLAFERILNKPKRGLGDATIQLIHQAARSRNVSMFIATGYLIDSGALKPRVKQTLFQFIQDFQRWQKLSQQLSVSELAEIILDESGYTEMWKQDKSPDAQGRLENLKELVRATQEFETLGGFLEHISLVTDTSAIQTEDAITLMTLHAAKGLEFEAVFLPGWEDGLFPSQRSMDESGQAGLEEERRLAYVGITRAKQKLYISYAQNRRLYNQWQSTVISRFINEIPKELCEFSGSAYFSAPKKQIYSDYEPYNKRDNRGYSQKSYPKMMNAVAQKVMFQKGDSIFHQQLGKGVLMAVEGERLIVQFENGLIKNIMADFVERL